MKPSLKPNLKPTLVIMAAGIGSRYGGLKQIEAIGPSGELMLDYSVYDAIRAGFGEVIFIIRPEIEVSFREVIGNKLNDRIKVQYAFQTLDDLPPAFSIPAGRTKPWGTGHAVFAARAAVQGPFAIINADDFYGRESFEVLAEHLSAIDPQSEDCCMVGFLIENTLSLHGGVARGHCEVREGHLATVTERFHIYRREDGIIQYGEEADLEEMADGEIVSMNAWGFTARIFEALGKGFAEFLAEEGGELRSEYMLPKQIDEMIQAGRTVATVLPTKEKWMGVTFREDREMVIAGIQTLIDAGVYPSNLWG